MMHGYTNTKFKIESYSFFLEKEYGNIPATNSPFITKWRISECDNWRKRDFVKY